MVDQDKDVMLSDEQPGDANFVPEKGDKTRVSPPSQPRRLATLLGYGALLLVLLLVGAGVFLLQELRSKQEGLGGELSKDDQQMLELTHQITGLQSELAALHNQFATLQSQVTTADAKFERQISEQVKSFNERLASNRSELEGEIQHIQRQLNKTRGDLMVADAEYLLSIANQKLHLVGDVKSVLAAMEAADQRLHDSGDPAAFKVRETLVEEINQLKKFSPPDVVGISARLLAMEEKAKELPLFLPHAGMTPPRPGAEKEKTPAPTGGKGEGDLFDSTLNNIRDLVTVRRSDRPVQAILQPEQAQALRQVMLLRLETTRAALLRGDDALYRTNLESALAWLAEHFDPNASATREMTEELKSLQGQQIKVSYPDIGKSLALLRNIEKIRLEAEEREAGGKPKTPEATAPKGDTGAQP